MTTNPYVELLHSDLSPSAILQTESRFIGTPAEQIQGALMTYRLLVINHTKNEIRKKSSVTAHDLLELADLASALYSRKFTILVGPSAIVSYLRAYKAAHEGTDVPLTLIYALADQHAERMGKYFHETSKEALLQGFNRMVNKGVPAKMAAERALDAFGLSPKQMAGYVALDPMIKVSSAMPRDVKSKVTAYIGRSIQRRLKVFATQEEHNLDQQAMQMAWMWLLDKGMLSSHATKVWLTERDERVCKVCGPMHGKRVHLTERFEMPGGAELYVPGAHVNCRCTVKLVDPISIVQKDFSPLEHPRARDGKFKNKYNVATRTKEKADTSAFQAFLDTAGAQTEEPVQEEATSFSMEPVRGGSFRMAEKFSMSDKFSMPDADIQFSLDPETNTFSLEDKPSFSLIADPTEFSLTAMVAAKGLLDENELKMAPKKKRKVFYREVHEFREPVYGFVDSSQIDEDGSVLLTGDEVFVPNRARIEAAAGQVHMDLVERAVSRAGEDGLDYLERYDDGGNQQHAYIDQEDLYEVAGALSSGKATMAGRTAEVIWYDHMGNEVDPGTHVGHMRVSYEEIAHQLGWGPEDFRVYIMRLDEGHNGTRGDTAAKGKGNEYNLTGKFNTVYGGGSPAGPVGEIQLLNGEPDTPMEQFGDHPDD